MSMLGWDRGLVCGNHLMFIYLVSHDKLPSYIWRQYSMFLFIQVYCPYTALGYERPTPNLLTDINIHSDTQAEPRKLSSLTLYIDLWQEGKPAPGQNPPVISPPMAIFRRIGVRSEIRTQNLVLSNTRLARMVPLSHLRRPVLYVHDTFVP
jgi:hypothetical protein